MLNLMKYELLRRKNLLIGAALSMVLAESVIVYGIFKGGNWNVLSGVLTVVLCVGAFLLPLLDTVAHFYSDFKHKHGFMLFMTPQSGYSIVWSKVLFGVAELAAVALLLLGCLYLSFSVANGFNSVLLTDFVEEMRRGLGAGGSSAMQLLFSFTGMVGLQLSAQLSVAVLALCVTRVIIPRNSYHWLVALLMYFALALGVDLLNSGVLLMFGFYGDIMRSVQNPNTILDMLGKYFAISAVTYFVWFIGCSFFSGFLINKNLDL
ncbi:MAG: hypothetical protein BWY11_02017 [Firmicutes bacterium ADurb.Bin182]|nr:MAG: hypothetical protein BWY11_02017 [Firmicutes bacterium ADurb.Bin182]